MNSDHPDSSQNTESDPIKAALNAFINADTAEEGRRILEEKKALLLSDEALNILRASIARHASISDEEEQHVAIALEGHLHLLEEARENGIAVAWQSFDKANEEFELTADAVEAFMNAQSLESKRRILEGQQAMLLSEMSLGLLRRALSDERTRGNKQMAEHIARNIRLLEDTKLHGIPAAWQSFEDQFDQQVIAELTNALRGNPEARARVENLMQELSDDPDAIVQMLNAAQQPRLEVPLELKSIMDEITRLNEPQMLPRKIDLITQALEHIDPVEYPHVWGTLHGERGSSYVKTLSGNHADNLEQAIADFDAALTVFSRQTAPYDWAKTLQNRGTIYRSRIVGDHGQNLERAIADYTTVLSAFTREVQPLIWAESLLHRGIAYTERTFGDRAQNIEQAIIDYTTALSVFTPELTPREWAVTLIELSTAYRVRIVGNQLINREQAIAGCTAALSVLTPELMPGEWALAMLTRGSSYAERGLGDKAQNLEQAIADYTAALTVLTREISPHHWGTTMLSRGNAYVERVLGDKAQNLERAIADYTAALSVFTREAYPRDWAFIMVNLGAAFLKQDEEAQRHKRALESYDSALTVFTRETAPGYYRDIQLNRATMLEAMQLWDEAHSALQEARSIQRELVITATNEDSRIGLIAERAQIDMYLRDAKVQLQLTPPHEAGAVIALEEGRAQFLHAAFELDTLHPEDMRDEAARIRAEKFVAARDQLREAQDRLGTPWPSELSNDEALTHQEILLQQLHAAQDALTAARDAIRHFDNPDFLTLLTTLTEIARPINRPDEAIVYLVAASPNGFAFIITRTSEGNPQINTLSLPEFNSTAVAKLIASGEQRTVQTDTGSVERSYVSGGLGHGLTEYGVLLTLQAWGESLNESLAHLPPDSGFAIAGQMLGKLWSNDPTLLSLFDRPFNSLTEEEINTLGSAFSGMLLREELPKVLNAIGVLGLSEVASWLHNRGIHRVAFIPYGLLSVFPLPAVLVQVDEVQKRLGDLFEVTITPNARALEIAYQRAAHLDRTQRPFLLAVGNPQPLPQDARNLPYAQAEAEATCRIAKALHYSSNHIHCLTLKQATKPQVVDILQHAWFAQLATHGMYIPEAPQQSMLLLSGDNTVAETDRILTVGECLRGKVNLRGLRLLILSACETAMSDYFTMANEMMGMATAFLQAGAAGVIASLWAVDDLATYLLMSRFTQLYLDPQKNKSPACALAEAQRWLREEATNRVLATYDPKAPFTDGSTSTQRVEGSYLEQAMELSEIRSTRFSYATVLNLIHAQATVSDPEALPYSDPIFWAAFTVTGC
jgi:CHAT domain-containing protein/tetratricopeptide (TPR) repeat protein